MDLILFRNKITTKLILKSGPDQGEKYLFKHCTGANIWPNKKKVELVVLLYLHGVRTINIKTHKSALKM